jgi:hypothetical protein
MLGDRPLIGCLFPARNSTGSLLHFWSPNPRRFQSRLDHDSELLMDDPSPGTIS